MSRNNSGNFNVTTLKLAEKFDHPFTHLFRFGNISAQGNGQKVDIFRLPLLFIRKCETKQKIPTVSQIYF